ncbi:MAG: ribosomal protein S5-alanine N-acetyltransferase [Enterobacteriaceae bacterium]
MLSYFSSPPQARLRTDRLLVRLAHERDAYRLADYYAENREFLRPWEPERDDSYRFPSGWQARLGIIDKLQRQKEAFYFLLLDPDETEVIGVANFSNVMRGIFHACYLGYSVGEKWQGQGLMYEAVQAAIRYMFQREKMHRIMANYMPHNQRSGHLLKKLGFDQEGYARKYLFINGTWQDHILTSLINEQWQVKSP